MARPQTPVVRTEVWVPIVELEAEVVPVPAFEAEGGFCPHAGTRTHMIMPTVMTRSVLLHRGRVMSCWTPTKGERFPRWCEARDTDGVSMREDCRHFESRTYESGEVARFCVLGLAPQAPWRCPENCPGHELPFISWRYETSELSRPLVEDEPGGTVDQNEAVFADAEAIVNDEEPEAIRDRETAEGEAGTRGWRSEFVRSYGTLKDPLDRRPESAHPQ